MKQVTEQHHVLETKDAPNMSWRNCTIESMYRPAVLLAYNGRFMEAIEAAQKIRIENYGDMRGVSFRVKTTTTTFTFVGSIEDHVN